MWLIANRPLRGDYGSLAAGETFSVPDSMAADLIKRGMAREAIPESEPLALIALRDAVIDAYEEQLAQEKPSKRRSRK